jgi:Family of unknown function (DUF6962)
MQFTPIPTQQTTAATDALLMAFSLLVAASLWRRRRAYPLKLWLWISVFLSLAVAGGLGALAHGLALEDVTRQWLWRPLNAALGLTVALIVTAAILDRWGEVAARYWLPRLVVLSAGFFIYATFVSKAFLVFIIYAGVAMLFCLLVYGTLHARRSLPGAAWMFTGVLLTLTAEAAQAVRSISFTLFLPFDSNGAFHLVQLLALASFWAGIRRACMPISGAARSATHPCAPAAPAQPQPPFRK